MEYFDGDRFNFIDWPLDNGDVVLYSVSTDWNDILNTYETAIKVRCAGDIVIDWVIVEHSSEEHLATSVHMCWVEYVREQHPMCFFDLDTRTIHAFIVD